MCLLRIYRASVGRYTRCGYWQERTSSSWRDDAKPFSRVASFQGIPVHKDSAVTAPTAQSANRIYAIADSFATTAPDILEREIIQPIRPFNWQQFNESEMPSEAGTVLRRFANGEKLTVARVSFAADSPMRTRMGSLRSSSPARWSSRSTATPVTVREDEFVHM